MAEIIEIPVENNSTISEYTPEQVGGIIAGVVFGLLFFDTKPKSNLDIFIPSLEGVKDKNNAYDW